MITAALFVQFHYPVHEYVVISKIPFFGNNSKSIITIIASRVIRFFITAKARKLNRYSIVL